MASKNNLYEELNSYNKQLDKHLQGVGIDLLGDLSTISNSLPSDQFEQLLLLSQSLKDIRTEMNLMRKHLSSDTEIMIKSLLNAQQKQFQEEMREFQQKTVSLLKIFDPAQLKEISSEISRISLDQKNISQEITSIKSHIESLNSFSKKKSESNFDNIVESQLLAISSKQEKLEKQIEHLFSKENDQSTTFQIMVKESLKEIEHSLLFKQKQHETFLIKQEKDVSHLSKKLEKLDSISKDFVQKVSKLDLELAATKKNILSSSEKSDNLISEKLSILEHDILHSKELEQNELNNKLSSLTNEIESIQKKVYNSSSTLDESSKDNIIDITSLSTNTNFSNEKKTQEKILDIDVRIKKLSSLK